MRAEPVKTKGSHVFTGYHLNPAALTGEQKTLAYHRYIEAFKFANGIKKHIRDPQFSSTEVSFTLQSSVFVTYYYEQDYYHYIYNYRSESVAHKQELRMLFISLS